MKCAICSNMDGPRDYDTKWSTQRKTNAIWYHLHVESKKCIQNELIYKNRKRLKVCESKSNSQTYGYQRGKVAGRDKLGVWD